jgi:nicotinamidase-related amidase
MLNSSDAVFVMVDFQGRLAQVVDRAALVAPNALKMIHGCQALDVPVVATLQAPEKLGPLLSPLAEALPDQDPISKMAFSALRAPAFLVALKRLERKQVLLAGIEAHVCVLQTGFDLLDAGYTVHVLEDGIFSRRAENHRLALHRLHEAGAVLSSVEMALFEMVRTADHPQFRTISGLVK